MQLGISGQALGREKNLEEILEILQKFRVDAVEFWPFNVPLKGESLEFQESRYEGRDVEEAKELVDQFEMEVACVTLGSFSKDFASDVDTYSSSLRYAVEVAKELGASVVNHYCYNIAMERGMGRKDLLPYFEPALNKAEELDVTLALENEAHDATRTPEGTLEIIETMDSDNFKTNFDATNYYHASQEAFPYAYDLLQDHIAYVHLKNGCIYNEKASHIEESKGQIMTGVRNPNYIYYPPIPEGAVNIDGLLSRLEEDGYDGFCSLEPHTTPENVVKYYEEETEYLRDKGFFE